MLLFDATALNLIHQPEGAENKDLNGHEKEKEREVKKKTNDEDEAHGGLGAKDADGTGHKGKQGSVSTITKNLLSSTLAPCLTPVPTPTLDSEPPTTAFESPTSVLLFDATALNLKHQPEDTGNKDPIGHEKEKKRKVKKKKKGGGRRQGATCTNEAGRRH